MATKEKVKKTTKKTTKKTNESTLYYFYAVGCGFCKKVDPIVDSLIADGYKILKLDVADSNNQGLKTELENGASALQGLKEEVGRNPTLSRNGRL